MSVSVAEWCFVCPVMFRLHLLPPQGWPLTGCMYLLLCVPLHPSVPSTVLCVRVSVCLVVCLCLYATLPVLSVPVCACCLTAVTGMVVQEELTEQNELSEWMAVQVFLTGFLSSSLFIQSNISSLLPLLITFVTLI